MKTVIASEDVVADGQDVMEYAGCEEEQDRRTKHCDDGLVMPFK